jgi:hypothetical protein
VYTGVDSPRIGFCSEHNNETLCSTKAREFLDQPSDYKILKEDSVELSQLLISAVH